MAYRFNPPPGWPTPPEGWAPPEGWKPDPAWPPAPEGWEFWLRQERVAAPSFPQSAPAPKKGKGLLISLIILGLLLAAAIAWVLMGALSSDSGPAQAEPPVVAEEPAEVPTAEPAPVTEAPDVDEANSAEPDSDPLDFDDLAREAGLEELLDFYNDFDSDPVSIAGEATLLGGGDPAELTTIFVGPAGSLEAQEVGTVTISEPVLGWVPDPAPDMCPEPQDGTEYIMVHIAANTGPALQDYPFSGIEIRFFDEAGNQTGVGNMVLTQMCLGDIGSVTTAWKRSGAHAGGLLAQVTPGTTSVAYSAQWGFGIDDTIYQWNLADL